MVSLYKSTLLEAQSEVSTVSDDLRCHVISWCWSTFFFFAILFSFYIFNSIVIVLLDLTKKQSISIATKHRCVHTMLYNKVCRFLLLQLIGGKR